MALNCNTLQMLLGKETQGGTPARIPEEIAEGMSGALAQKKKN